MLAVYSNALLVEFLDRCTFCAGYMPLPVNSAFLSRAEGRAGRAWLSMTVKLYAQGVPVLRLPVASAGALCPVRHQWRTS